MRFSITQKLFLAFLGLTLFTLVASLGLSRWSFERGFRDYVREREQDRLEVVRDVLASEYRMTDGSWNSITPSRFEEIVSTTFPRRPENGAEGSPPRPRGNRPPGSPRGPREERLADERTKNHRRGPPTALFDADGQLLAGTELEGPPAEQFRVPIAFAGTTVGELRSSLVIKASSPQDAAFAEQQVRTGWVIGMVAMVLAAVLSMVLARGLLAPVKRMVTNVARLSSGNYSARLAEPRDDELGQLMADLDHLGMTLDEDRTARQRWLANISHELRTPLTVLSGELEAMKDGVRKFDAEQLESLQQEVQRLRFLIDDLHELSVSDVGGLRYKMSSFNVAELLRSLVSATRNRANASGLEISISSDEDIRINGDAKRIDQLFQNLFENSIAYTDVPGRIEVSVAQHGATIIIEFNDSGPGATAEDCEQLFEPLYRLEESRNRRTGGSGLGLSICRNIVEAHRGKITATPSALGGLCIRIEMPAACEKRNE